MNKCEEAGFDHCWEGIPHTTLEYRTDGLYPQHRECKNCGKEQIMNLKWDDVNVSGDENE